MPGQVEAVMLGAGNRGFFAHGPAALAHPEELRFTAVAEPDPDRRRRFGAEHRISPERQLGSADELWAAGQLAEALFNCTPDDQHFRTTCQALDQGYQVMLEKPMATTAEESRRLVELAERRGSILAVAHVLRYTPFFSTLHSILESGELGEVVSVEHRENVAHWHMAHSFVRGHWRRLEGGSPMILAKCCHDLDLLSWNLGPVARLSSFGSLRHFRPGQAPPGAPLRCDEGCPAEEECAFSATRLYLGEATGWPVNAISEDLSLEGRRLALSTGPYGRCVYRCDNDVVDHQVVALEFESGATGVLTMQGHSHEEARTMRYDGTRATLRGRFQKLRGNHLEIHRHRDGRARELLPDSGHDDHGGGDTGLMRAFVRAVWRARQGGLATDVVDASDTIASARDCLHGHLLAFAAEESRIIGSVVAPQSLQEVGA